jgi:hypothetical protein
MKVLLVFAALLAACGMACSMAPKPLPPMPVGTYIFTQTIPSQNGAPSTEINGTVHILPDTVLVDVSSGPCKAPAQTATFRNQGFYYSCYGYGLSFAREDPLNRATYSMSTVVTQNKTVCVEYATDAQGHRYCARTEVQQVETTVTRTGYLKLRKSS